MSLERYFEYTCDKCQKTERKSTYLFPKGWTYLPANLQRREIEHRCPECREPGCKEGGEL